MAEHTGDEEADATPAVEVIDGARRTAWLRVLSAALAILAVTTAWLWWDAQGFDPGDTLQVTAEVTACGRLHVAAGGERWVSGDWGVGPSVPEGDLVLGELHRTSENRAEFTPESTDAAVRLERSRPDLYVTLGCRIPELGDSGGQS